MSVVIQVESLSKYYRLGLIGGGTLREDLNRWWAKARGRPDPLLKIGDTDHGNRVGGELWALRDVSFQVREGEILGIIGRNGAGKSTLLKILSRITAPTSGQVKIKGRIGSLLEVGTGFHPELTGRENIYLNGAILGMKKAEIDRKLDEIIDFAEIEQFIDTPVKRYSSGMYVRLAFAVAAHLEPEILIVDEVLAVGDAAFQKKCLWKLNQVSAGGRTVLFVSHNLVAVNSLCTRIILLDRGLIDFCGSVNDGVRRYSSLNDQIVSLGFADRNDRVGNGRLRFVDCFFSQDKVTRLREIGCGEAAYVHLIYQAEIDLKYCSFAFNLYESEGYILLNFNTEDLNYKVSIRAGRGELICYLPSLPLRAGRYFGNLYCTDGADVTDWIQKAFSIDVVDTDIHGTGRIINQGKFVAPCSWEES